MIEIYTSPAKFRQIVILSKIFDKKNWPACKLFSYHDINSKLEVFIYLLEDTQYTFFKQRNNEATILQSEGRNTNNL